MEFRIGIIAPERRRSTGRLFTYELFSFVGFSLESLVSEASASCRDSVNFQLLLYGVGVTARQMLVPPQPYI